MVEKTIDDNHDGSVTTYASDLIKKIKSGSYKSLTDDWLACSSTTEPLSTRAEPDLDPGAQLERELKAFVRRAGNSDEAAAVAITPLECPIVWARESNAFDCVSQPVHLGVHDF